MVQSQYGNFRFDSLGRPVECADWIAAGYGFLIYWIVFRAVAKLRMNLDMIKEPFQRSKSLMAISE